MLVAASDARGTPKGEPLAGRARFVDEGELVLLLLRKKYGWQKRGLDAFNGLMRRLQRRPHAPWAYIEIVDQQQV